MLQKLSGSRRLSFQEHAPGFAGTRSGVQVSSCPFNFTKRTILMPLRGVLATLTPTPRSAPRPAALRQSFRRAKLTLHFIRLHPLKGEGLTPQAAN